MERGHRVEVEGVARARLERADAALAEHDVVVSLAHDVLGGHEQLVDGPGDASLEQDGRARLADLLEEVEVLRVAGADLHDVDSAVHEELHVADVHDLGDDGHAGLGFCLEQQVEAALAHALVGVRGGAGLVGAAAQHGRAGRLAAAGDLDEVVALDRAGARYDLKRAAADLDAAAEVDHGVSGVEFAVGLLEGLGDALDALDDVHRFEQERVDLGGVAHKADDRLVGAAAYMGGEALALDPRDDMGDGLVRGVFAQDGDHVPVLSDARAGRVPASDSSCSCS